MDEVAQRKMIRLSKSCIGEAEKKAVLGVLDREYLGMGAEVQQFEQALTEFFGRPTVCVVNGTAALHLALQAAGVGHGDQVLVQSLTYVASFQAISATGATPIACDVDPLTLTLDWRDAERRLTPRTKAVMPVHYSGGVGSWNEIYEFATRNGLRVVEDAAHAFGTEYQGKRVGGSGDIACFSFDGIKNITAGEGGCIVTDDEEILERVRDSRLLGVKKDTEKRYAGARSWEFDVTEQGWRYHMSNIMAAIGIEQLKRYKEISRIRQDYASQYFNRLSTNKSLTLFEVDYENVVPHIFPLLLPREKCRDRIRSRLGELGVETGLHYPPCNKLSLYKSGYELPITQDISPRLLTIPLHTGLKTTDIDFVCEKLEQVIHE